MMELLDDLKSNFRSWEQDHETTEDFNMLVNIMSQRHPNVAYYEIEEKCSAWLGLTEHTID